MNQKQTLEGRHSPSVMLHNLDIYVLKHLQSTDYRFCINSQNATVLLRLLSVAPPSAGGGGDVLTSLVWKQTASRAAKAKWLLLVNWVSPQMIL